MLKNYLIIALRNVLRNKTLSFINIFGLSLAFLCSILLFINAYFELSFDNFLKDRNQLFKLYNYVLSPEGEQLSGSMGYPVAPTLKKEIPEIIAATRFMHGSTSIEYNGKKLDMRLNFVDEDFFNVFSYALISGNKKNPLNDLGNIVLSKESATRLFNKEEPIGKRVKVQISGQLKEMMVSAVLEDSPQNASIIFDALVRPELRHDFQENKENWNSQHHDVYIKIAANTTQKSIENKLRFLIKKHNPGDTEYLKNNGYVKDSNGDYFSLRLLPLGELHFNNSLGAGGNTTSKMYIYSLLLISFFILAIACFNFINLNIARSFNRAKEVGVRKCLGASSKQIFSQLWGESLWVCFVAVLIGFILSLSIFPLFNQLFGAQLRLNFFAKPSTFLMLLLSIICVSLFAGGYPSLVISKLSTSSVLKGKFSIKKPGLFRNSLIVLQFSMACLLMVCTLVVFKQFDYMRSMPLGLNKDNVISIPLYNATNGRNAVNQFRNRLSSESSIKSVTGSNINIGVGKDGSRSKQSSGFGYKDKTINTNWMSVDYDFLKTLGIKTIVGRDFNKEFATDTISNLIVTESMVKQFGEKDPLNISFSMDSTRPKYHIIGVIPDFHLYSAHEKTEPLSIDISYESPIQYVFIKTSGSNPKVIMEKVELIYKELEPGKEFKGSFMDENTNRWYNKEKKLSLLLGISSIVAIILSRLGLFALALLMIQQRIKEIGIRKVLGASVTAINYLLTKDFLKLVLLAIVIATPLSWWLMNQWLQDFPYRTTIGWLLLAVVGLTLIVIALITVGFHTIRAAITNPVKNLRTE